MWSGHVALYVVSYAVPVPSQITLIGLGLITASHAVLAYYSPGLVEPAPGWVYVMQAVCLFMYSTLDNMDGKQARRTGSSSPLGLLFDHGTRRSASCLQRIMQTQRWVSHCNEQAVML